MAESHDVYNSSCNDVKKMIDGMTGARPNDPLTSKERTKVFCRKFWCVEKKEKCVGCAIPTIAKYTMWILLAILLILFACGMVYLFGVVISNCIALWFTDTRCENWVWGPCDTLVIYYDVNNTAHGISNAGLSTAIGFFIQLSIAVPLMIGLIHYFDPYWKGCSMLFSCFKYADCCFQCCSNEIDKFNEHRRGSGVCLLVMISIVWIMIWIPISLFVGKELAVNKFSGCDVYAEYGIIADTSYTIDMPQKYKVQRINGIGSGGLYNPNLPGSSEEYKQCLLKGFFTIYLCATIGIPLVIAMIVLLRRRCININKEIDEINNGQGV